MKTYKIHLIRHGRTEANEKGLYIGLTDLPLSPGGLRELLELKEKFVYPEARRFFTSPLTRCRQTLEVLYPGCRPETVDGLAECDFGDWDGRSIAELQSDPLFRRWMAGDKVRIPDGEDAQAFQKRVMEAFEGVVQELMRTGDTEAVVCTHGGVIMMILMAYALPRLEMSECVAQSGNGFTLRITPSVWMREPVAEALCMIPWERDE